jgi:hypothetical protein
MQKTRLPFWRQFKCAALQYGLLSIDDTIYELSINKLDRWRSIFATCQESKAHRATMLRKDFAGTDKRQKTGKMSSLFADSSSGRHQRPS